MHEVEKKKVESKKMQKVEKKKTERCMGWRKSEVPELPREIIEEILLRQPVKSLVRFKCVCKEWEILLTDPWFITSHMTYKNPNKNPSQILFLKDENEGFLYTADFESFSQIQKFRLPFLDLAYNSGFSLASMCDGLVCIRYGTFSPTQLCVYNPATREYLLIPDHDYRKTDSRPACYGLGFDPIIKKYKVVSITYICDYAYIGDSTVWDTFIWRTVVKVITFGSNRWRRIKQYCSVPYVCSEFTNASMGGAVHWLASRSYQFWPTHTSPNSIISFNFQREVFQEIPLPKFRSSVETFSICLLGVVEGCLSLSARSVNASDMEIWAMKEYGVKESWTKLFKVNLDDSLVRGFGVFGRFLRQEEIGKLLLCNQESKTEERDPARLPQVPCLHYTRCASFVESLVPLRLAAQEQLQERRKLRSSRRKEKKDRRKRKKATRKIVFFMFCIITLLYVAYVY